MYRYLKTDTIQHVASVAAPTGTWMAFVWSVVEPYYGIVQFVALLAAITASIASYRYSTARRKALEDEAE